MLAAIREIAKVTLAGHGSGGFTGSRHARRAGVWQSASAQNRTASDPVRLAQLHRFNYVWLGTQTRAVPCIMEPGWCCQHLARHESENPNSVFASEELQLDEASRGCGRRREWAGESRTDRTHLE